MNDDLIVQKISKLLQNNTSFIGYALNGGIGTKINVRNTETGKTIQALSINVDSNGEVLVVKDSADGQYKAVTFKTAEKVSEKIIQLRKTKPIDDKKTIEYTDSDIEVFYLFVKLIDTGSPVPTDLTSTWIRRGNSCSQFVGAYERCNYAAKDTIGGISYQGLPYIHHTSLDSCLADTGRDTGTPNGDGIRGPGGGGGSPQIPPARPYIPTCNLPPALLPDNNNLYYFAIDHTIKNYWILTDGPGAYEFGEILTQTRNHSFSSDGNKVFMTTKNTTRGNHWNVTEPIYNRSLDQPPTESTQQVFPVSVSTINSYLSSLVNSSGHVVVNDYYYVHHTGTPDLVGTYAGYWKYAEQIATYEYSFVIYGGNPPRVSPSNESPCGNSFPLPAYSPPPPGTTIPYPNGQGNLPAQDPLLPKRNMKLSTHKAEIWLGSNKKEEAIKLYELGVSDLFSSSYNALIMRAEDTQKDERSGISEVTNEMILDHEIYYSNRDRNAIDLLIKPKDWIYTLNNQPRVGKANPSYYKLDPKNESLQDLIDGLYNRAITLTVLDSKNLVIHLKLGLTSSNILSNTDCKGKLSMDTPTVDSAVFSGQSWEYQKYVTINVKNWQIDSTSNTLDTSNLKEGVWNKSYIERKFLTSPKNVIGGELTRTDGSKMPILSNLIEGYRDRPNTLILRPDGNISIDEVLAGNNFEQYNYSVANKYTDTTFSYYNSYVNPNLITSNTGDKFRHAGLSTNSWWSLWDKTHYDSKTQRLSSVVGYEKNISQIITTYGLDNTLDYSGANLKNGTYSLKDFLGNSSIFEYLPSSPLCMIPSNIKSVRTKKIDSATINSKYKNLNDRKFLMEGLGLNFYFSDKKSEWIGSQKTSRTDGFTDTTPYQSYLNSLYITGGYGDSSPDTRESKINMANNVSKERIDTKRWSNSLWVQLIFTGSVIVDVDSYKGVKFTPPTNPSQYIKYAEQPIYTNDEFLFSPLNTTTTPVPMQSVLSPGVLDVAKQVKITKPTNVEIDPNMSFLVYTIPFCTVTKKTKEI